MPVFHLSAEISKCPLPMGRASARGRKYTTSPASSVNCRHAACVSDGSSWKEHSFHLGLTCSVGVSPLCEPLCPACDNVGQLPLCAAAGEGDSVTASAVAAVM